MKCSNFVRGSVLLATVAASSLVASTPPDPQRYAADDPAGTAGMRVYLDPETGGLQAMPAAAAEFALDAETQNAVRRDTQGLSLVRHPNGAVSMDLQGRYQSVATIRIDDNGTATFCDDNGANIGSALDGRATPATPEVK